jgi:hypothetical protein
MNHVSRDPVPSSTGINIHTPQLHRIRRGPFKTEGIDHPIFLDRHPKTSSALTIIVCNSVNLLGQCTFNVGRKGGAQVSRTKEPIKR